MNTKKKILILLTAVIFTAAAALGGLVACTKGENDGKNPAFSFVRYEYAIREWDREGIQLTREWTRGQPFKAFTVRYGESGLIEINAEMKVTAGLLPEGEREKTVTAGFYYKGAPVAEYVVTVFSEMNCKYLMSAADLESLNELGNVAFLGGVLVQAADIAVPNGRAMGIVAENTTLYGNYFTISGVDMKDGGLFAKLKNSRATGVRLSGVKGAVNVTGDEKKYGALAAWSDNVSYTDCEARGAYTLYLSDASVFAGGLTGMTDGPQRRSDEQENLNVMQNCRSFVNITATGKGVLYLGGLAGKANEMLFMNCRNEGALRVDMNYMYVTGSTSYFQDVRIGGIAGEAYKAYIRFENGIARISYFDQSENLTNAGEIIFTVAEENNGYHAFIGGIFGAVINQNLNGAVSAGNMEVRTAGAVMRVGATAGQAENRLNLTLVPMCLKGLTSSASIGLWDAGNPIGGIGQAGNVLNQVDIE
jgi:hypothetical protein